MNTIRLAKIAAVGALAITVALGGIPERVAISTVHAALFQGFPYSTPITLNLDGTRLWVVNPDADNNSVTVVDVANDVNEVIAEIPVGEEPNSVAVYADDSRVYVANTVSGTVSVVDAERLRVTKTIPVGVEPRALCFTPNFSKLYVACSSSNDIHVIDPATDRVVKVIENPTFSNLFAITITNDGDTDDSDEVLYVTNLFAEYKGGGAPRPADDTGKEGIVSVIQVSTDTFVDQVRLQPVVTAFQSDGRAQNATVTGLDATQKAPTTAFPNLLTSIAGTRQNGQNLIYTFSTGSSPTGPIKFNVILQSLLCLIRGVDDAGQTANFNDEIRLESQAALNGTPRHRFATMPWGLAFFHNSYRALGVSSACDYVVEITFDANGKGTIVPNGPANINRILTGRGLTARTDLELFRDGKAPRGVVISPNDLRAYTFNYVSRDVSVIDLTRNITFEVVPTTGSKGDPDIQYGKELFNSAMGPVDTSNKVNGAVDPKEGRMADFGWCACVSCHVNGLTDGVAWGFPSGPRLSVPMNTTFAPKTGAQEQRALNWSAIFDEVADFELNTRGVAGGAGLIENADGSVDPNVKAFDPASGGRDFRRDAITLYVRTIRSPIAPEDDNDREVIKGRKLFQKVGCANCHNTALWTRSRVLFPAPPPAAEVVDGQLVGQLVDVGTFDATKPHEVIGTGANINRTALGAAGFNIPSLLGVASRERFLTHDGSVTSFDQIFNNPAHVGTHPKLAKPKTRQLIIKFLRSIDDRSQPFQ